MMKHKDLEGAGGGTLVWRGETCTAALLPTTTSDGASTDFYIVAVLPKPDEATATSKQTKPESLDAAQEEIKNNAAGLRELVRTKELSRAMVELPRLERKMKPATITDMCGALLPKELMHNLDHITEEEDPDNASAWRASPMRVNKVAHATYLKLNETGLRGGRGHGRHLLALVRRRRRRPAARDHPLRPRLPAVHHGPRRHAARAVPLARRDRRGPQGRARRAGGVKVGGLGGHLGKGNVPAGRCACVRGSACVSICRNLIGSLGSALQTRTPRTSNLPFRTRGGGGGHAAKKEALQGERARGRARAGRARRVSEEAAPQGLRAPRAASSDRARMEGREGAHDAQCRERRQRLPRVRVQRRRHVLRVRADGRGRRRCASRGAQGDDGRPKVRGDGEEEEEGGRGRL